MNSEKTIIKVEDVESVVSEYVGIPVSEIRGKNTKSAFVKARHFSIYLLHTKYGFTGGELSKIYSTTRHRIFDICAQIRGYAQVDAIYRAELNEVQKLIDDRF